MAETPLTPPADRERLAEILFESLHVPALHTVNSGVLAMYGSGRKTGLSIECGHGVTHIVPVHNGRPLDHATKQLKFGGQDVTRYLVRLFLAERGYEFTTRSEHEEVCQIKETVAHVPLDLEVELLKPASEVEREYELPDGQMILAGHELVRCTEALFQPSLFGADYDGVSGIHRAAFESLLACDVGATGVRSELSRNVVLSGGSTMFPGMRERMQHELTRFTLTSTAAVATTSVDPPPAPGIEVSAAPERKYAVWIGGSVLASLSSMRSRWITKLAYDECGASIVHRAPN